MAVARTSEILRFGLAASVGIQPGDARVERLTQLLRAASPTPVSLIMAANYEDLGKRMRLAELDFCWAPPFICARLEALGFPILLRGVRKGASTYRSALVAATEGVNVDWLRGKRAVWVDRDSVSGYMLPLAFLKSQGFDLNRDFASQGFAGSFVAAAEQVASGQADFTAVFAPPAGVHWRGQTGLAEMAPRLEDKLKIVALTEEVPNSGLAMGRSVPPGWAASVRGAFERICTQPANATLLTDLFQVDAFEPAPKMGYRALYRLAVTTI